jgi:metallo-beta-lactamase family protein
MQLVFYGADKEVTGSCHCLEACGKRILIDCGLQQGADEDNNREFPFYAQQIDYVIVTHAHIDHSGRLPLLVKNGYQGKIYATGATCDLLSIMLRDSAHIQEMDAMIANRKGETRRKKAAGTALYGCGCTGCNRTASAMCLRGNRAAV